MARLLLDTLAGEGFEEGLVDVLADVGGDEPRTQVRCWSGCCAAAAVGASRGQVQVRRRLNLGAW